MTTNENLTSGTHQVATDLCVLIADQYTAWLLETTRLISSSEELKELSLKLRGDLLKQIELNLFKLKASTQILTSNSSSKTMDFSHQLGINLLKIACETWSGLLSMALMQQSLAEQGRTSPKSGVNDTTVTDESEEAAA